jgi:hypothetical protein
MGFCCARTRNFQAVLSGRREKLVRHYFKGGAIVFAITGHETNARMAIRDCKRKLRADRDTPYSEGEIEEAVRESVWKIHTKYVIPTKSDTSFELLFGILRLGCEPSLLASSNGGIEEVDESVERGSGWYLADYVIRSYEPSKMAIDQVVILALRFLSATKQHCEGVGGFSQFVIIDKGGLSLTVTYEFNLTEQYILQYEQSCSELLLSVADPTLDDGTVRTSIDRFAEEALKIRGAVRANSDMYKSFISQLRRSTEQPN